MVAGQEAVIYNRQTIYPYLSRSASLIHPIQKYLITIETGDYGENIDPIDLEVMDIVISSLKIVF